MKKRKNDFAKMLKKDKLAIKQDLIPVIRKLADNVNEANVNSTTTAIVNVVVNKVRDHFNKKYKWSVEECTFIGDKEISQVAGMDMFDVETYDYAKFL